MDHENAVRSRITSSVTCCTCNNCEQLTARLSVLKVPRALIQIMLLHAESVAFGTRLRGFKGKG